VCRPGLLCIGMQHVVQVSGLTIEPCLENEGRQGIGTSPLVDKRGANTGTALKEWIDCVLEPRKRSSPVNSARRAVVFLLVTAYNTAAL